MSESLTVRYSVVHHSDATACGDRFELSEFYLNWTVVQLTEHVLSGTSAVRNSNAGSVEVIYYRAFGLHDRLYISFTLLFYTSYFNSCSCRCGSCLGCLGLVIENRSRTSEVADSILTPSNASNPKKVFNIRNAQANSASKPQRDWK